MLVGGVAAAHATLSTLLLVTLASSLIGVPYCQEGKLMSGGRLGGVESQQGDERAAASL